MILKNNREGVQIDGEISTTKRMSISSSVEGHIIGILTKNSYSDPLGSLVRETLSNCIDSHSEAGVTKPAILRLLPTKTGDYELQFIDEGLGLDHESFDKYIMGIGESTKRDNPDLLGGYGIGAKSGLAYTDSFTYLCRKDGIERKFLIFKGEEFPESTMLYEQPTTEHNGVVVTVPIDQWDKDDAIAKIKEQCSYFENVYFDVQGLDNTYNIYKGNDFMFNTLNNYPEMHISLKGVYYPINWSKLGMVRIPCPVALRFDDYSLLQPIFNREQLDWSKEAIEAIKAKIRLVAELFVQNFNKNVTEYDSILDCYDLIDNRSYLYEVIPGRKINIGGLLIHATTVAEDFTVKGIKLQTLSFYKSQINEIFYLYNYIAQKNYKAKLQTKRLFKPDILKEMKSSYNPGNIISTKAIIIGDNDKLTGMFKDYLINKGYKHFFRRDEHRFLNLKTWRRLLMLADVPKKQWKARIEEAIFVTNNVLERTLFDGSRMSSSEEYIQYRKDNKAYYQSNSNYKTLNKQTGDVTMSVPRQAHRNGAGVVIEKQVFRLEKLHQYPKTVLLFTKDQEEKCKDYYQMFSSINPYLEFRVVGPLDLKKILSLKLHNHMLFAKHVEDKPLHINEFRRVATALLFYRELNNYKELVRNQEIANYLPNISKAAEILEEFTGKHNTNNNFSQLLLQEAILTDNFDKTLWDEYTLIKEFNEKFSFLKFVSYRNSNGTREEFAKFINHQLLMKMKTSKEDFTHLQVVKVEPVIVIEPEPEVEITAILRDPEDDEENVPNLGDDFFVPEEEEEGFEDDEYAGEGKDDLNEDDWVLEGEPELVDDDDDEIDDVLPF